MRVYKVIFDYEQRHAVGCQIVAKIKAATYSEAVWQARDLAEEAGEQVHVVSVEAE